MYQKKHVLGWMSASQETLLSPSQSHCDCYSFSIYLSHLARHLASFPCEVLQVLKYILEKKKYNSKNA